MVRDARALDVIPTRSEAAALALEAALVQELRPPYNVLLKDDRRHPYLLLTLSEEYPRILVTRTRRRLRAPDRLYGPFVDEGRLRHVLNCIQSAFPLRQRPKRLFADRPCINYDLGRCPGVCQRLISPEEYRETIAKVDKLLSGRIEQVLDELREEMDRFSDAMQYEQAAQSRDRIALLEKVFFDDPVPSQSADDHPTASQFGMPSADVAGIVDLDPFVSRDVFAIASSEKAAKVVLFQVRGGKVISRLVFSVAPSQASSPAEDVLAAVLSSHYAAAGHPMEIPEEVVLCSRASDTSILKSALSEKRGKAVSVRSPGPNTAPLARIVQHNADVELKLESQRASDVARDLQELAVFLAPHFRGLVRREVPEDESVDRRVLSETDDATSSPGEATPATTLPERSVIPLHRIEGYDISHTGGSNAVGSMAVFLDGVPAPNEHRKYPLAQSISSQGHPDDYESIRETLQQRFQSFPVGSYSSALASSSLPDLLVIDGGKGQLQAALDALDALGLRELLPVVSIAKGHEEVFVPGKSDSINYNEETGAPFMNNGVRLICRIRDEAHRTALAAHRKRRGRRALRSGLDSVPGLGSVKKTTLLEHFNGSSEAVASAPRAELEKVRGIGRALAQRIFDHFHTTTVPS